MTSTAPEPADRPIVDGGVETLDGVVRHYDWGDRHAIPELLGAEPDGRPWAELWLGAHPAAPASVGPRRRRLDEVIAAAPERALGPELSARFGSLPFLLKILAAARPLSLQAHPSLEQARAGFDREEAAGIPRDAPERCFRDRSHKPELICALGPFHALCGFRDPAATLELLEDLGVPALDPLRGMLESDPGPEGLDRALRWLLGLGVAEAGSLVDAVVGACRGADPDHPRADEFRTAVELARSHPGDAGVVTSLLLNRVTLRPGQALYLDAGQLHAYLGGVGVEIMASSDNVLRGGLTSKHVDVATLLDIVDTRPSAPGIQDPGPTAPGGATFDTPVEEFRLRRIAGDQTVSVTGPAVVTVVQGVAEVGGLVRRRGTSAWIPASAGEVAVDVDGEVFVATSGPT